MENKDTSIPCATVQGMLNFLARKFKTTRNNDYTNPPLLAQQGTPGMTPDPSRTHKGCLTATGYRPHRCSPPSQPSESLGSRHTGRFSGYRSRRR